MLIFQYLVKVEAVDFTFFKQFQRINKVREGNLPGLVEVERQKTRPSRYVDGSAKKACGELVLFYL